MPALRLPTRVLCLAVAAGLLFGCEGAPKTVPWQPRETSVDPAVAAGKINAYRVERGRTPLAVDPQLNRIAAQTARILADRAQLRTELHTRTGLVQRLEAADYAAVAAAENLGAGYPTLDTAIEGWKGSRGHNRNLLNRQMTRMGIGLALTNRGKFGSYWVLLLARPDPDAAGAS